MIAQTQRRNQWLWLVLGLPLLVLVVIFAKKVTQLSLPGLGVSPKTAVIDPKCPTPQQKEVIERNINLYGAGFSQGYDNTHYAKNLQKKPVKPTRFSGGIVQLRSPQV